MTFMTLDVLHNKVMANTCYLYKKLKKSLSDYKGLRSKSTLQHIQAKLGVRIIVGSKFHRGSM